MNGYIELIARLEARKAGQEETFKQHQAITNKIISLGNPANGPLIAKLNVKGKRYKQAIHETELEILALRDLAKAK